MECRGRGHGGGRGWTEAIGRALSHSSLFWKNQQTKMEYNLISHISFLPPTLSLSSNTGRCCAGQDPGHRRGK